jgi:hypothetical protein
LVTSKVFKTTAIFVAGSQELQALPGSGLALATIQTSNVGEGYEELGGGTIAILAQQLVRAAGGQPAIPTVVRMAYDLDGFMIKRVSGLLRTRRRSCLRVLLRTRMIPGIVYKPDQRNVQLFTTGSVTSID